MWVECSEIQHREQLMDGNLLQCCVSYYGLIRGQDVESAARTDSTKVSAP